MIMFGSFLPSLLVGVSTTNSTRAWEPTLSWNQLHSLTRRTGLHYRVLMTEPHCTSGDFGPGYRLDAKGRQAAEDDRLSLLEQIFDPYSRRRRELVQPGWRCLEIGAGRGSMARWLAEQVGPSGHVVATDIDTRYLQKLDLPNLEVVEHDILEGPLGLLG